MRYIRKKINDYQSPCDKLMHSVRTKQEKETETQRLERIKHEAIFKARDTPVETDKTSDAFDALLDDNT